MPFPDYTPTASNLLARFKQFADKELIVLGDTRLTYAEVEAQSRVVAKGLLAAGVTKGTKVGLLLNNSPEFIVSHMAASRIGAVSVPINTFFKEKELGYVLRHADIDTLIAMPALFANNYVERLEECIPALANHSADRPLFTEDFPFLRRIYFIGEDSPGWGLPLKTLTDNSLDDDFLRAAETNVSPADPLVIIYSSGSTSDPKGAVHSHGAVIRHSLNLHSKRRLSATDRMYCMMPFFWIGGLVFNYYSLLHVGACVVCELAFDAPKTLELLERERVTLFSGWPHYMQAAAEHPDAQKRDLSHLRGNTIDPKYPKKPPGNGLGMTETCGPHSLEDFDSDVRGSHGAALEGIERKIVDPGTGQELPVNEYGELCVRGYSVMQGLYKVEREEAFGPDGYYHTGDLCRIDENGLLHFKARKGDMIKSAGANVTPAEVEAVINQLDNVHLSCVIGLPHPTRGQDVAAAIVLQERASETEESLRLKIKDQLAAYKVPKRIFIMAKTELPFTDSGKIHKAKLVEKLAAMKD